MFSKYVLNFLAHKDYRQLENVIHFEVLFF